MFIKRSTYWLCGFYLAVGSFLVGIGEIIGSRAAALIAAYLSVAAIVGNAIQRKRTARKVPAR